MSKRRSIKHSLESGLQWATGDVLIWTVVVVVFLLIVFFLGYRLF